MPTVQQIQHAQDEIKRLNKITEIVIPTLSELYGAPNWMVKPKEDQNPDKILKQWADALGGYADHQLKMACLKYYKYNKAGGFPTLGKISSELCEEKEEDYAAYRQPEKEFKNGFNIEHWIMQHDGGKDLENIKFILPDYKALVKFVIDERLPEKVGFSEWQRLNDLERKFGKGGIKFKTAWENGLFEDREAILPLIQRYRRGEDVSIPIAPFEQRMDNENFDNFDLCGE